MEQIIVKQEIIESVYKEISILEKLEEKYDEILDLIKKFEKVSNDSSELNLKYLSISDLKGTMNCPENIIHMSLINLMHSRLDLLKPIDLKLELGFQRNLYFFISDLIKIIEKSKGQSSLGNEINSLLNIYTDEYLEEVFEKFIIK